MPNSRGLGIEDWNGKQDEEHEHDRACKLSSRVHHTRFGSVRGISTYPPLYQQAAHLQHLFSALHTFHSRTFQYSIPLGGYPQGSYRRKKRYTSMKIRVQPNVGYERTICLSYSMLSLVRISVHGYIISHLALATLTFSRSRTMT